MALAIGYQGFFVANSSAKNHHVSKYSLPSLKYDGHIITGPTLQTVLLNRGALYVAFERSILVLNAKTGQHLRTIRQDVLCPDALAVDPAGDLFVANYGCNLSGNFVTVYRRGTGQLLHKITDGIKGPVALAFDAIANLYVANNTGNDVAVYVHRETSPFYIITNGISRPTALTLNTYGDLYVANTGGSSGTVTEYSIGGMSPVRTITVGIDNPVALGLAKQ